MLLSEILATLQPAASGYTVTVTEDWGQGRATYGGLVAAVGNEAMRKVVGAERPLRSLQTTFVGPASAGTWSLKTRVLRIGKAVTLTSCDIIDREQIVATQVGVYASARNSVVKVRPPIASAARPVEELRDVR